MFAFIEAHWVGILAALQSLWIAVNVAFNRIANSLPAPTKDSSEKYVWWFQFVNNMALNSERAKNNARIEDSPNFVAAAEAYMQKKLRENGKA